MDFYKGTTVPLIDEKDAVYCYRYLAKEWLFVSDVSLSCGQGGSDVAVSISLAGGDAGGMDQDQHYIPAPAAGTTVRATVVTNCGQTVYSQDLALSATAGASPFEASYNTPEVDCTVNLSGFHVNTSFNEEVFQTWFPWAADYGDTEYRMRSDGSDVPPLQLVGGKCASPPPSPPPPPCKATCGGKKKRAKDWIKSCKQSACAGCSKCQPPLSPPPASPSPPPAPASSGPCIKTCGGKRKTAKDWKKSCTSKKTKAKCKGCCACGGPCKPPPPLPPLQCVGTCKFSNKKLKKKSCKKLTCKGCCACGGPCLPPPPSASPPPAQCFPLRCKTNTAKLKKKNC
jgi:hypothetical protein